MKDDVRLLKPREFPSLLREIPDPPKQLYLRGNMPPEEYSWLAVVGSRAATPYGRQALHYLIEGLRGYPIVIVSGLAYGIDAEAHKAALEGGLPTVAVPGSGLHWDILYPRANVNLAREILKKNGALLSEFEPEQKAAEYTFPQRNRVMAGLCHATLVVEAKERSGSLITARLTTEYNRELLVVPGSIFSPESRGTHQFLKLGATPVTEPEDILRALGISADTKQSPKHTDLSGQEKIVLELIASPLSRDDLISALKIPVSQANILLSAMEIKGLIVEEFGTIRAKI